MNITRMQQVLGLYCIALSDGQQAIPSGSLYAIGLEHGLTLDEHSAIIDTLTRIGLVSNKNNLIRWTGPAAVRQTIQQVVNEQNKS